MFVEASCLPSTILQGLRNYNDNNYFIAKVKSVLTQNRDPKKLVLSTKEKGSCAS